MPHTTISPSQLFWGNMVVLMTTENPDGSPNISPMSSAWWFAHRSVLGVLAMSQTAQNMLRNKKCVLNLASQDMTSSVNLLARTTGVSPVPDFKAAMGYVCVKDKFEHAKLTLQESAIGGPPRVKECKVQMECEVVAWTEMMADLPDKKGVMLSFEVKILKTHVLDEIRLEGYENRIDADKWHPMYHVFSQYYGGGEKLTETSELAKIDPEMYRAVVE
ncbi:Uncharacterized protein LSUE1_G009488 [Lachnellula suecica]|uniref:Flavin reductase like domain-containing protein n=1 Tax=Lachnellula suecica TaxID=602035 RepID=A0A8T9BYJ3_9HELO|nr:Uncharacterized protein LSUE1_G009488 [Lachnellula suecica]